MKDEWREKQTQRWTMGRNLDIIACEADRNYDFFPYL